MERKELERKRWRGKSWRERGGDEIDSKNVNKAIGSSENSSRSRRAVRVIKLPHTGDGLSTGDSGAKVWIKYIG